MDFGDTLSGNQQELRRGTVVLACLLLLRQPGYGYALLDQLRDLGFAVDANTLYPLLRRLESQGLLTSSWDTEESRPRKFYRPTPTASASPPSCSPTGSDSMPPSAASTWETRHDLHSHPP